MSEGARDTRTPWRTLPEVFCKGMSLDILVEIDHDPRWEVKRVTLEPVDFPVDSDFLRQEWAWARRDPLRSEIPPETHTALAINLEHNALALVVWAPGISTAASQYISPE